MIVPQKIYAFWEPRGGMPSYLRLCVRTWERNLPGFEIVLLDHSNLDNYLRPGTYDLRGLKAIGFSQQKDAIQVAILEQHGGYFFDVDTIATGRIDWIAKRLQRSDVAMFGFHFGFMAARPHAALLAECVARVRERLARLAGPNPPPWDWEYAGNAPMREIMQQAVLASPWAWPFRGVANSTRSPGPLHKIRARVWHRAWRTSYGLLFPDRLFMFHRKRSGFIVEPSNELHAHFWCEEQVDAAPVVRRGQLIGLHNSWMPEWYRQLSEDEVLAHPCRLSRLLRQELALEQGASVS